MHRKAQRGGPHEVDRGPGKGRGKLLDAGTAGPLWPMSSSVRRSADMMLMVIITSKII